MKVIVLYSNASLTRFRPVIWQICFISQQRLLRIRFREASWRTLGLSRQGTNIQGKTQKLPTRSVVANGLIRSQILCSST